MAKKIALLLSLVMMFTISCVFATESDAVVTSEAPVAAEDVVESSDEEAVEVSGDDVATEEPAASGEVSTSGEAENDHDHEEEGNGSAVVGAVIAVVIVVAIVAIVWILNKK